MAHVVAAFVWVPQGVANLVREVPFTQRERDPTPRRRVEDRSRPKTTRSPLGKSHTQYAGGKKTQ